MSQPQYPQPQFRPSQQAPQAQQPQYQQSQYSQQPQYQQTQPTGQSDASANTARFQAFVDTSEERPASSGLPRGAVIGGIVVVAVLALIVIVAFA